MRGSIRVYFSTPKHFNSSELGISTEVFRKRRALNHEKNDLRFNIFTLKMLRSSNASKWVDSTNS